MRIATVIGLVLLLSQTAYADQLCVKKRVRGQRINLAKAIRLVDGDCPRRFRSILDTDTLRGEDGTDGADGSSIYGDASAGDLTVDSDTTLFRSNTQYGDVTIDAGVTLTIPAGSIIRCTGAFTNNGTITIGSDAGSGRYNGFTPVSRFNGERVPTQGLANRAASNGSNGTDAEDIPGGEGGNVLSNHRTMIASKLYHGVAPGGAGGAGSAQGKDGGGAGYIFCRGAVTNAGTITANGADGGGFPSGSGGGAGGLVVLASATSVTNSGAVIAAGSSGSGSSATNSAGGGGGGGVIHLVAPIVTNSGVTNVSAGTAGSTVTAVTDSPRAAGGGGGAFGGNGGDGASVATDDSQSGVEDGSDGFVVTQEADPSGLL